MNRDPVFELLAPFAWVVVAAFVLGFGGVLAVAAPHLARDLSTLSRPSLASSLAATPGNPAKLI